jgi:hypothetical protein
MKLTHEELMYFINDKHETELTLIEYTLVNRLRLAIEKFAEVATSDKCGDLETAMCQLEDECIRIVKDSIHFKGRC